MSVSVTFEIANDEESIEWINTIFNQIVLNLKLYFNIIMNIKIYF